MDKSHDGRWCLCRQEHGDNDDQHECGTIGITDLSTFGLSILFEEPIPCLLSLTQGSKEQQVQDHEGRAGDDVDKKDPERVIADVVEVNGHDA